MQVLYIKHLLLFFLNEQIAGAYNAKTIIEKTVKCLNKYYLHSLATKRSFVFEYLSMKFLWKNIFLWKAYMDF